MLALACAVAACTASTNTPTRTRAGGRSSVGAGSAVSGGTSTGTGGPGGQRSGHRTSGPTGRAPAKGTPGVGRPDPTVGQTLLIGANDVPGYTLKSASLLAANHGASATFQDTAGHTITDNVIVLPGQVPAKTVRSIAATAREQLGSGAVEHALGVANGELVSAGTRAVAVFAAGRAYVTLLCRGSAAVPDATIQAVARAQFNRLRGN